MREDTIKYILSNMKSSVVDKVISINIFKLLTEDNTIKNYSYNKNGIWVDLKDIPEYKLDKVREMIKAYVVRNKEIIEYEKSRKKVIVECEDGMVDKCVFLKHPLLPTEVDDIYQQDLEQDLEQDLDVEYISE
jgi:hypothetical protein